MHIRVLFFAVLRDIFGRDETSMEVPPGSRALDVWDSLRAGRDELVRYSVPPLTAINQSYASADTLLSDGDELVFLPPVAGG